MGVGEEGRGKRGKGRGNNFREPVLKRYQWSHHAQFSSAESPPVSPTSQMSLAPCCQPHSSGPTHLWEMKTAVTLWKEVGKGGHISYPYMLHTTKFVVISGLIMDLDS